jgi:hypothetical protein
LHIDRAFPKNKQKCSIDVLVFFSFTYAAVQVVMDQAVNNLDEEVVVVVVVDKNVVEMT